ncbi:hypothetical protein K474DRAFT_1365451 [Panus rudis PR-1116 ss-1]|nr:hypothetical protein K474DRAFT_1365451 [Panus rudis PR-1116 ss-1]
MDCSFPSISSSSSTSRVLDTYVHGEHLTCVLCHCEQGTSADYTYNALGFSQERRASQEGVVAELLRRCMTLIIVVDWANQPFSLRITSRRPGGGISSRPRGIDHGPATLMRNHFLGGCPDDSFRSQAAHVKPELYPPAQKSRDGREGLLANCPAYPSEDRVGCSAEARACYMLRMMCLLRLLTVMDSSPCLAPVTQNRPREFSRRRGDHIFFPPATADFYLSPAQCHRRSCEDDRTYILCRNHLC